jgi:hypothetical protein
MVKPWSTVKPWPTNKLGSRIGIGSPISHSTGVKSVAMKTARHALHTAWWAQAVQKTGALPPSRNTQADPEGNAISQ